MKAPEHKFKRSMPFEAVPAFLRRLADAIEKKADRLPGEWPHLPEPLSKLTVKGKRGAGGWEIKVKLKSDGPSRPSSKEAAAPLSEGAPVASESAAVQYKDLKKRMKTTFKAIGQAIENQDWPEDDTLCAFLADAERMTAFSGAAYGDACYPAFREACRNLSEAYGIQDWSAFQASYGSLNQLKKGCHKACK